MRSRALRGNIQLVVVALWSCLALGRLSAATDNPDQIPVTILVRHAEKATDPSDDPPLSEAGKARAEDLATALKDAGVAAIVVTNFRRTQDTAKPLAAKIGVTPQAIDVGTSESAHVQAVVAAIRAHPNSVVLVVGHSNTVPAIIKALGVPQVTDIAPTAYSNLYVLVPAGGHIRLVHGHYGKADP